VRLTPDEQNLIDALSTKKLCLKLAQNRLLSSVCFQVILSYLCDEKILPFQKLSKKLYEFHVPQVLRQIPVYCPSFMSITQKKAIRALFEYEVTFSQLYVGSLHAFSAF
jgi:hypothetical protein